MNTEMLNRMKTAGEYQKKAIRALFPHEVGGHLDVIEKEIKMMILEIAADMVEECRKSDGCEEKKAGMANGIEKVEIL